MKYDEYFKMVLDKINDSITTTDKVLREKIYASVLKWYKTKYEPKVRELITSGEEHKLIYITRQINKVCESSDIDKLRLTYDDIYFEELKKLSEEVFNYVVKLIDNKSNYLDDLKNQEYLNKVKELKVNVSPVFKEDADRIMSEIDLDLKYLKANGNIENYSIRTGFYLRAKQQ